MHDQPNEREIPTELTAGISKRIAGRFLKGPIPLVAICAAAQLPGQSLALYLAIRHRSDLTRSEKITVPATLLRSLGINKDAKARALKHLTLAGLVAVERRRGQSARITVTPEPGGRND